MKHLLFLLLPLSAAAQQKDTIYSYSYTSWVDEKSKSQIDVYDDGKIVITGDTIRCIKLLLDQIDSANARRADLWKSITASIKFANTVPDYFKDKNPNFLLWIESLKPYGYNYGPAKPRKKP